VETVGRSKDGLRVVFAAPIVEQVSRGLAHLVLVEEGFLAQVVELGKRF
jgi:hypothetical protein